MALVYCEICGVLIKSQQEQEAPEGVICDSCFGSRRAVVTDAPAAAPDPEAVVQFNCCYCRSLLRLRAVGKRTRIKCPKCTDHFYLNPDGRIESRLEGNTTAVFQAEVGLSALTPSSGTSAEPMKTQPIRREAPMSKTQPIRRDDVAAAGQQALLDELKPKKLEFLEHVPTRGKAETAFVDTDSFDSPKLELAPEGGGKKRTGDPPTAILRPSEEGRIDLDAEGLRRKTAKYQQAKLSGGDGKTPTRKLKRNEEPEAEPAPAAAEEEKAEKDAKREERERRAAEAAKKSKELEAKDARKQLGALTLTSLSLLPAVITLLVLTMTLRGTGFATRGKVGEHLESFGHAVERGTRSLGGMLNPHLPPELRLPE